MTASRHRERSAAIQCVNKRLGWIATSLGSSRLKAAPFNDKSVELRSLN